MTLDFSSICAIKFVSLLTKAGAYGSFLEGHFLFIRNVKLWKWKEEKYENAFWVKLLAKYVIDDNLINALGSAHEDVDVWIKAVPSLNTRPG